MSQYRFNEIEKKWQQFWAENNLYKVTEDPSKPKYYVLDMFPYPSGAGLHVGHPLGYIASDIVSRYKRLNGFNVLHPMGYDAFGLPAEQYAIQTGLHPAVTTENNIATFRRQLDIMGFSYDWSREVRTCDPGYYKWTQWIFGLFFTHWYDKIANKARPVHELIQHFTFHGSAGIDAACSSPMNFTASEWAALSPKMKDDVLNNYRLAFIDETTVNWCEAMGTVLANEEVVNGVSERGGYPVVRKKMKQWSLRITAYADRLLEGLDRIDWTDSIKEIQRNWIGRSEGAEIQFKVDSLQSTVGDTVIEVFTTRPDTVFGATFMVLAPEYEGLGDLCSDAQRSEVMAYAEKAKNRSEIDRMADTKKTGVFTGIHCINPFTGQPIPVWVSDYVLAGYGTGAIMAVPAHDERDFEFATAFNLPIIPVIKPENEEIEVPLKEAFSAKDGVCFNSGFLDGMTVKNAIKRAIEEVETLGIGKRKINYKLREAGFGRQRYWGEPFPIVFDNQGIPQLINELPVELPKVESYKPTGTGESPLAAVKDWVNTNSGTRETDTMPGWAGSSWYFLRYTDPNNSDSFAGHKALDYWKQVDLYVGGSEHATGHLLYSRFWTKFLYDLGFISWDEPFKKLVNQGMIVGESKLLMVVGKTTSINNKGDVIEEEYILPPIKKEGQNVLGVVRYIHFPVEYFEFSNGKYYLSKESFDLLKNDYPQFKNFKWVDETIELIISKDSKFALELRNYEFDFSNLNRNRVEATTVIEKMSKRWLNAINPNDVIAQYSADALRLYEMFLGPLTDSKPWNTNGIEGVSRFLGKFWRLFHDGELFDVSDDAPTAEELKVLHKTIKKVTWDIENMSFNTSVAAFMVATNELGQLKCRKKAVLEPLLILLAPFAPHMTEELWHILGHSDSIHKAKWPIHDEKYLIESTFSYPISINGKTRTNIEFPLDMDAAEIEKSVMADETVQRWMEGKPLKKFILVKGRIVNVVV